MFNFRLNLTNLKSVSIRILNNVRGCAECLKNEDGRRVLFSFKGNPGGEKYFFKLFFAITFLFFLFIDAHCFAHMATLVGTNADPTSACRPWPCPHSMLHTRGAPHAHAASFKIIYNSTKPKVLLRFCFRRLPVGSLVLLSACRRPLVDPRQLLHDLNDLVHGGLALHTAAVVDLEPGDRKRWREKGTRWTNISVCWGKICKF